VPTQLTIQPTKGSCTFAMAFQIDRGGFGTVKLDGLGFVVLGFTPGEMGKGNWSVGLIADERAGAEQREAITAIASGSAGGPMSALSGLIGRHWRGGPLGALQVGVRHGVYCLGCCWALMCVLFAVGVMNLVWVAALTVFILLEKAGPRALVARFAGAALMALGIVMIAHG
jgi:hypothetical protein